MADTLAGSLRDELVALLAPLATIDTPAGFRAMLASFGHTDAMSEQAQLRTALQQAAALVDELGQIDAATLDTWEGVAHTLRVAADIFVALRSVENAIADPSLLEQAKDLGAQIVNRLIALHLRMQHPSAYRAASLLTLVGPAEIATPSPLVVTNGQIVRMPWVDDRIQLERTRDLIRDPWTTLRDAYFPNGLTHAADAQAAADRLLPLIALLATELGLRSYRDLYSLDPPPPSIDEPSFGDHFSDPAPEDGPPGEGDSLAIQLRRLPRLVTLIPALDGTAQLAVDMIVSSAEHETGVAGVIATLDGALSWSQTRGNWKLDFNTDGKVPAFVFGPEGLSLAPMSAPLVGASGRFGASRVDTSAPAWLFGNAKGTRVEVGNARFGVDFTLSPARNAIELSMEVDKAVLAIVASDGDSFLKSVLPADGLRAEFDLGLVLSSDKGLSLHGAGGLEATIPIDRSLAGITLSTLYLSLVVKDERLTLEASASIGASIGPVQAAVDRLGLAAAVSFPETGGNLGVADLDFRFKPPTGLGLSIDAAGVVGGGYIGLDPEKGEYSGILQLEIAERINVKAFGLLSTRLPDGAKGYSLIVFITAEDFQPIQLGMGFKLQGIGGMLAINRTFDEAAMREGLKNNSLALLLFPRDPIRNAPEILRNLATVFPARIGSYLFGPMAKIGWATPTLIQLDLALILEIGARRRLIVLGRISSILPTPEKDLIRLNMDAMGVFDFDVGTISMDAVLVDSRLLQKFVLTGSMAMRACLVPGPRAGFALAVGGMNPHFSPPESMPKLDRIAINLTSGDNPRFTCDAYFAVTANTIQFGSRSTMYAAAYGFSIEGDVGFDVLVQLLPFHFLAEFEASIQLKRGSQNLFKVKVNGALEGPRPLRVSAKATFEILWCDFSIHFDKTLIEGEQPEAPPAVNALDELLRVLSLPDSWNSDLPQARRHGVTMRKLPANEPLTLDPLGELMVRQSVLPLNTNRDMDVFGGAPLSGARRFTITTATLNATTQSVRPARDLFAPAQFFDLSDDDKLASPSFEEMDSGVVFGSDVVIFDESATQRVYAPLEYETITIDEAGEEVPAAAGEAPYVLDANRLHQQLRFASVAKAAVRNTGLARFRNAATSSPPVTVVTPEWLVASTTDLNVLAPDSIGGVSWGDARVALEELRRDQPDGVPQWQLIPAYELVP